MNNNIFLLIIFVRSSKFNSHREMHYVNNMLLLRLLGLLTNRFPKRDIALQTLHAADISRCRHFTQKRLQVRSSIQSISYTNDSWQNISFKPISYKPLLHQTDWTKTTLYESLLIIFASDFAHIILYKLPSYKSFSHKLCHTEYFHAKYLMPTFLWPQGFQGQGLKTSWPQGV